MGTKRKERIRELLLVFFLALLLRSLLHLIPRQNYFLRTDDFGPLIYPATLAGYDWRSLISGTAKYYGYGYYWIFFPLFTLNLTAKQLILIISGINSLALAMSSMLIYYICRHFLQMKSRWPAIFTAVLATVFVGDIDLTSNAIAFRTDNEIPFFLACWMTVWAFLLNCKWKESSTGKRAGAAACLALIQTWGLMVHERYLALVLGIGITILFYFFAKRKWLVHPVIFGPVLVIGFVTQRMIRNHLLLYYWGSTSVGNTSAFKNVSADFILVNTYANVKAFFYIFFGNLHSLFLKSNGLAVAAMAVVILWSLVMLKEGISILFQHKKGHAAGKDDNKEEPAMLLMFLFGVTILIVITGLSVKFGRSLVKNFQHLAIGKGYKALCYSRYYYGLIGPVVTGLFAWLYQKREKIKKGPILMSLFLLAITEGIFLWKIYPLCLKYGTQRCLSYLLFSSWRNRDNLAIDYGIVIFQLGMLYFSSRFSFSLTSVSRGEIAQRNGICKKVRKDFIWVLCLILVLVPVITYRVESFAGKSLGFEWKHTELENILREYAQTEDGLPETIYYKKGDFSAKYQLQLSFPEQKFIGGTPSKKEKDQPTIAIWKGVSEKMESWGYTCMIVDAEKDIRIYTNIEELAGMS